jgi:hypothetical protein
MTERIPITVPKDIGKSIRDCAERSGRSVSKYLIYCHTSNLKGEIKPLPDLDVKPAVKKVTVKLEGIRKKTGENTFVAYPKSRSIDPGSIGKKTKMK